MTAPDERPAEHAADAAEAEQAMAPAEQPAVGWLPGPADAIFGEGATAEEAYDLLTVDVPATGWIAALEQARSTLGCTYFDWLSAVDEPGTGFRIAAHVAALARPGDGGPAVRRLLVRTTVPHDAPALPTATGVYAGAGWHERETHEMFGVTFTGHPHLEPLLLPEGFEGHPLRKDFVLAARVAKAWPGAKEPGESDHGGPKRRQMLPPGVPDPNEWGPLKGQLPPAPARPARGARAAGAAAGERPVRRARTASAGSASQGAEAASASAAPGTTAAGAAAAPAGVERPARRSRTASAGSASQREAAPETQETPPTPETPQSPQSPETPQTPEATPAEGTAPAGPARPARRSRTAAGGSASQRPEAAEAAPAEGTAPADGAAAPTDRAAAPTDRAASPVRPARPSRRSSDAPWHHPRPAHDEPSPDEKPSAPQSAEPAEPVEAAGADGSEGSQTDAGNRTGTAQDQGQGQGQDQDQHDGGDR